MAAHTWTRRVLGCLILLIVPLTSLVATAREHREGAASSTATISPPVVATIPPESPAAPPPAAATPSVGPSELTAPAPPGVASSSPPPGTARLLETYEHGGAILEQSFYSPAVRQEISYWIFLPPDYHRSDRRYAVLYMLHGLDADPGQWPSLGLCEVADRLIGEDAIEPLLIVMPFGSNSYFLNQPDDGLRWADHIRQDVVADVDARYRTLAQDESRAIGGLSMGGDAALRFALTDPEVFGVVGAHSPSIRRSYADAPEGLYPDAEAFRRASPLWLVEQSPAARELKIWLDIGDGDPWWRGVEVLHDLLTEQEIAHEFHSFEGVHDADYWSAHVGDYLRFYSSALVHR